ncbi:MAG: hypothetical protein ACR2MF_01770 [Chthoniobacterales bacterium]
MYKQFGPSIILMVFNMFSQLVPAGAASTPVPDLTTGIEGTILAGPLNGGPTRQGVAGVGPLANTAFVVHKDDTLVASFPTDSQGRFRLALAPGRYRIFNKGGTGKSGKLVSYGPFEVDIVSGRMTKVQWECDTGLR